MERYDYGLWAAVAFNAAALLFFLVAFLRPARRREWGGFGVVAAFVVALFTEMYGFPLTIYLLAAALGREPFANPFAHESGNVVASLLGIGDQWSWVFMLAGSVVIGTGLIVVAASWRLVHAAQATGRWSPTGRTPSSATRSTAH